MAVRLNKWGNSLGARLPSHLTRACGLAAGDYVFIRLDDATGDLVMRPAKARDVDARYYAKRDIDARDEPAQSGSKTIGGSTPAKPPVW